MSSKYLKVFISLVTCQNQIFSFQQLFQIHSLNAYKEAFFCANKFSNHLLNSGAGAQFPRIKHTFA